METPCFLGLAVNDVCEVVRVVVVGREGTASASTFSRTTG